MVLRRFFHIEKRIDKPAQNQAIDGIKKKRPIFPVNIFDVVKRLNLYVVQKIRNL